MERVLADPGFAGDQGDADPALAAALEAWAAGLGSERAIRRALPTARVLVPVVAVATGVEASGAEKGTDMAVVTLRGADGAVALPAFTSLNALADWHRAARPLPITAARAGAAALFEKADLLVIDPAGPVTFRVEGAALHSLALGRGPLPIAQDQAVLTALRVHLDAEPGVRSAALVETDDEAELDGVLALTLATPTDGDLEAPAHRLSAALAGDPVLRERLERGLDVAVLPAGRRLAAGVVLVDRDAH
jgi:type III secretion system (T3SS) SseB-like protein